MNPITANRNGADMKRSTVFSRDDRAARFAPVLVALLLAGMGVACGTAAEQRSTAATSGPQTSDAASSSALSDEEFFTPPNPLPAGKPGEIVRSDRFDAFHSAEGHRMLFHSTSVDGKDVAISGRVFVPPEGTNGVGDARIAVVAQSRGSVADECAASRDSSYERDAQPIGNWSERDFAELLLDAGYVVAVPDYEGFGTPGPGRFLSGTGAAHNELDAARATRNLLKTPEAPVVTVGNSQGGHAALWAAQLAPTYAPDVRLAGVFAGHPISEMGRIAGPMGASEQFGNVLLTYAGLVSDNPALQNSALLTGAGRQKLESFETTCGQDVIDSVASDPPTDYLTAPAAPAEDFLAVLDQNSPGDIPTTVPVLLLHGANAEPIPQVVSDLLFSHLCTTGGFSVEYRKHPGTAEEANKDNEPYLLTWLADRLGGAAPPTTPCA